MEESALVLRRAPWCGGERPGVEESALVWRRAPWCGGERPGVEEAALLLSRAPWCAGERPSMEEGALVWRRVPWCGGGRPGVDEDAWMPLERGGWRARFGGERLRRESIESTSDTSRKRTRLALRGRLMPRRREGRPPLPVSAPVLGIKAYGQMRVSLHGSKKMQNEKTPDEKQ